MLDELGHQLGQPLSGKGIEAIAAGLQFWQDWNADPDIARFPEDNTAYDAAWRQIAARLDETTAGNAAACEIAIGTRAIVVLDRWSDDGRGGERALNRVLYGVEAAVSAGRAGYTGALEELAAADIDEYMVRPLADVAMYASIEYN